jgi:hypothetical protein
MTKNCTVVAFQKISCVVMSWPRSRYQGSMQRARPINFQCPPSQSSMHTQNMLKHRCTTPVEHAPPQPATSNLRIALQDFRLNPCTSRDAAVETSTEVAGSRVDVELKHSKLKGQKAIGDFFRRSDGAHNGEHQPTSSEDAQGMSRFYILLFIKCGSPSYHNCHVKSTQLCRKGPMRRAIAGVVNMRHQVDCQC